MAKVSIDSVKETAKLGFNVGIAKVGVTVGPSGTKAEVGFDVGIGKAGISVGPSGIKGEVGVNLGIGKIGASISPSGPGVTIGLGPVSIGLGPNSASGFESMEIDFGVAKQTTKQVGCTITRKTWIAGVGIVETEVWTDPGCEPKEEASAPTPISTPISGVDGVTIPSSKNCKGGRFVIAAELFYGWFSTDGGKTGDWIVPIQEKLANKIAYNLADIGSEAASDKRMADNYWGAGNWTTIELKYTSPLIKEGWWYFEPDNFLPYHLPFRGTVWSYLPAVSYIVNASVLKYQGKGYSGGYWFTSDYISYEITITNITEPPKCPYGEISPPPPPSLPNKPPEPMDKGCCAMLKELHEFFQVERIKKKGFEIPNRLQIAGGEGESTYNNWMEITEALIRISDHLGLHPLSVSVADLRSDIEGEQSFGANFASGTQGIQAAMSQLWTSNGKADTVTTFLYKLSVLTLQMMLLNCKQSGDLQALKEMIGGSTESAVESVRTPLNIAAGVKTTAAEKTRGKGFDKNKQSAQQPIEEKPPEFDPAMADPNVLFPEFLKNRDNEIAIARFVGDKDLFDLLMIIIMKLEKLEYRG